MTSAHLLAKRAFAVPAKAVRFARRAPTRWVLTFHEVGDHAWAVTAGRFEQILEAVRAAAAVVPLSDLLDADPAGPLRAAITFDDGYAGVSERALPVLERLGARATVFLPTALLQESDALPPQDRGLYEGVPLMGWGTVRRLAKSSPLAFESHGATHRALPGLPAEERRNDLLRSREAIAAATGIAPRFLAYPFGAADPETAASAKQVGFAAAFTTRHGGIRATSDSFLLPRVDVRADYAPRDVLSILRGDWDFLSWAQALRGKGA